MKRVFGAVGLCLVVLSVTSLLTAKGNKAKPGPAAGTWECRLHGGPNDDMSFTLYLEQNGQTVTGSVSSPIGSTELTTASFKKKILEIHIDTPQGNYLLTGKLNKGQMSGAWSADGGAGGEKTKGTWEGARYVPTAPQTPVIEGSTSGGAEANAIQAEIDQIKGGRHGSIPSPQAVSTSRGGGNIISIKNSTGYALSVYFAGPSSRQLEIPAGDTQQVQLLPGQYQVAARASDPAVIPFWGPESFAADTRYPFEFVIDSHAP
ncbi:MAG: hypothetical protein ACLQOO_17670 [Terriglobia bacterium]